MPGLHIAASALVVAIFAIAPFAIADAGPQIVTGSYSFDDGDLEQWIDIHVGEDGSVTGLHGAGSSIAPTYFEGTYADGVATGKYYTSSTILNIVFRFEFENDVLTQYIYYSQEELPEPTYLLRRPGHGPTAAIVAPLEVLLRQGDNDAVVARGESGAELQLRDGRAIVDLLNLVIREAGLGGAAFTGRYYVDQLTRARAAFLGSQPEAQSMLAGSETWWPEIELDWQQAPSATKSRIAADALLLAFDFDDLVSWHQDPDLASSSQGDCPGIAGCIVAAVELAELGRARERLPCFRLNGCGLYSRD